MSSFRRAAALVALVVVGGVAIVVVRVRERNKETMWSLYADIHNLATSQAAYYADHASFATDLSDRYSPTHGATVQITAASDTSWSAVETHPRTSKTCSISYSERRGASVNEVNAARAAAMRGYVCK